MANLLSEKVKEILGSGEGVQPDSEEIKGWRKTYHQMVADRASMRQMAQSIRDEIEDAFGLEPRS